VNVFEWMVYVFLTAKRGHVICKVRQCAVLCLVKVISAGLSILLLHCFTN